MRVVRVEDRAGAGEEIALHPQLTVVRGLTGDGRARFVDAVGRIDPERVEGGRGELESSGVLLPFDADALDLLDLRTAHDTVITAQHLGVAGPVPDPGSTVLPVGEQADPVATEPDLDPVSRWFKDAPAHDLDPEPPAAAIGPGTDRGPSPEPDPAPPVRHEPLVRRIAALRNRRSELHGLASGIVPVAAGKVRAALEALEAAPDGLPVAGATELADAWADLQKDLKGLDIGTTREERVAMTAVARAQEAVAEAEAVLRQPQLTEDQIARIEAAHLAYIEASDKVERRFGGGRGRKQLAEAEAEELRLLSRFGFESWVDYMLNTSKRAADPDMTKERADLEAAQLELEVCLGELDAIPGAVGRRRRRARLHERQEELSDRIAALLGRQPVGDDVEAELRGLTAPADHRSEATLLARALEAAGVEVPGGARDVDRLMEAARHLLAAEAHAEKRRSELTVAVEAIDGALEVLDAALEGGATEVPQLPDLPDMAEPPVGLLDFLDDEPEPVTQLEMDMGLAPAAPAGDDAEVSERDDEPGDDDPDRDVAGIEKLFDPDALHQQRPADEHAGSLAVELAAPSAAPTAVEAYAGPVGVQAATAGPDGSPDRYVPRDLTDRAALVDDIHWEAMQLIADGLSDGPAGQLPVVFDDPFGLLDPDECIDVLSRLARLSDHVQMVVVTDRPEVAAWAEAVGPEHAAVVSVVS